MSHNIHFRLSRHQLIFSSYHLVWYVTMYVHVLHKLRVPKPQFMTYGRRKRTVTCVYLNGKENSEIQIHVYI